jgi:hypothetical protein
MLDIIWDLVSRVYANILMIIMGDAPLAASTVLTLLCGGSAFLGIMALIIYSTTRTESPAPIITQQASPQANTLLPALVMVFVLFVMLSGGILFLLAR